MAQNNDLTLYSMAYLDDPATLIENERDALVALKNFGQIIGLEKSFPITEEIGILIGVNGGYSNTTFNFERRDGNVNKARINDLKHIGLHSGLSVSYDLLEAIDFQLKFRAGFLYFRQDILVTQEFDPAEDQDVLMENPTLTIMTTLFPHSINPQKKLQSFVHPEVNLGYNLNKIPLRISLGFGYIFSPKTIITGEVLNYFQNSEMVDSSFHSYEDALRANGICLGISYKFEK